MLKSKIHESQKRITEIKTPAPGLQCREVDFVLECNGAEHVYVCGEFNDWHPTCLRMVGSAESGLWAKRLVLPVGRYEYKFVVDGKWLHDPDSNENITNTYGSLNSVVEVQP